MKSFVAGSVNDLHRIARRILEDMHGSKIFCFEGKMGAGKTTLIKAFCKALGSYDVVTSPTFALVNEYEDEYGLSIFHFDFYRVDRLEEVYDMGFEEYVDSGDYCFIEWPKIILELLPEPYVVVSIEVNDRDERLISYTVYPE